MVAIPGKRLLDLGMPNRTRQKWTQKTKTLTDRRTDRQEGKKTLSEITARIYMNR